MIKDNERNKSTARPYFHPTFGSRPQSIVGRDQEIEEFLEGLKEPIGSHNRCTFFKGQRGMGKTALLLELADRAQALDYVVARVTAYSGMEEDIIETIQLNGAKYIKDKPSVQGFEAGAFGFNFGLTFTDEADRQYGFRTKLTLLCDKLAEAGKGILILVDEARTSDEMRKLAVTYQHLVGEEKNIAIAMAGLPQAVSSLLNDEVLTFLNRAKKVELEPISDNEVDIYYKRAFTDMGISFSDNDIACLTEKTHGFPYLMQLIGYYITKSLGSDRKITGEIINTAVAYSAKDMEQNVFEPILAPLSEIDIQFLRAMAEDTGSSKTADIYKRMQKSNSFIQTYRARLIEAGLIVPVRKGEVALTVPELAGYLKKRNA